MIPVLRTEGISKEFPGVKAVDRIHFDLYPGEIHAIVGENGAGKSTFINLLCGALEPDGGTLFYKEEKITGHSPAKAKSMGIGVICQEFNLVPHLTVAENIVLGHSNTRKGPGLVDWKRVKEKAPEVLSSMESDLDVDSPVSLLDVAQQQIVEIAKALATNTTVLIMDEPTAALSDRDIERLFSLIRTLRGRGVSIIYISHRLEEVFRLADRISVFRNGIKVLTCRTAETTLANTVKAMVGRDVKEIYIRTKRPAGEVILSVRGLGKEPHFRHIDFQVRSGEIVGIFGLLGAGQTPLCKALYGDTHYEAGEIAVKGRRVGIDRPLLAKEAGMGYVPLDRKKEDLILIRPLRENITIANLTDYAVVGFVKGTKERAGARRWVNELSIRASGVESPVRTLSGGNQQKTVLAKWLEAKCDLLIMNEPTRGVDVGAKADIYKILDRLCHEGKGILVVSTDIPEIIGISDHILIMSGGRIVADIPAETATEEQVLQLANQGRIRP
jgi:ribose transport system ATP-binding protein